jgi:hypothetical protein
MQGLGSFVIVRGLSLLTVGFAVNFAVKLSHYFVVGDGFEKACLPAFLKLFLLFHSVVDGLFTIGPFVVACHLNPTFHHCPRFVEGIRANRRV